MKISHWCILFTGIFILLTLPDFYKSEYSIAALRMQTAYTNCLTAAVHDGVKEVKLIDGNAWHYPKDRQKGWNRFFSTLSFTLNLNKDTLIGGVPCVILIDKEGFYTAYQENDSPVISSINTYAAQAGDYIIRFYLDDTVAVIHDGVEETFYDTRKTYQGTETARYLEEGGQIIEEVLPEGMTVVQKGWQNAYLAFPEEALNFLRTADDFYAFRQEVMVQEILSQAEFCINKRNMHNLIYEAAYQLGMEEAEASDWTNILKGPTILAFFQGPKTGIGAGSVNIYAFAGGEITQAEQYFIGADKKYHLMGGKCDNGGQEQYYSNMRDAATGAGRENPTVEGYSPCRICIP